MNTFFIIKPYKVLAIWLTLFCIYGNPKKCLAHHVLGGELTYEETGKDTFVVRATIYNDCKASTNFYGPIYFQSICGGGTVGAGSEFISSKEITPVCTKSCTQCSNSSCTMPGIKAAVYETTIILSKYNCNIFKFSFEICCRSNSITTGASNTKLYLEAFLDKSSDKLQSSPKFTNDPLFIAPINRCISFSNSTIAENGDSLVYKIISPKRAPGSEVGFSDGYSKDQPLIYDGYPDNIPDWDAPKKCKGFNLDKTNGLLQFKATQGVITVIAIEVEQWKKDSSGQAYLAGTTQRESVISIIDNSSNSGPILTGINGTASTELINCRGDSVNFTIYSFDANSDSVQLSYEHNIPDANVEITKDKWPKLIFKWLPDSAALQKGFFEVVLYAKDNVCPFPATTTKIIKIILNNRYDAKGLKKEYLGCNTYKIYPVAPLPNKKCRWYLNDILFSTDSVFVLNATSSGNHIIGLEVDGYCVTNSTDSLKMEKIMGVKSNEIKVCSGDNVKLVAFGGHKYWWYPGNVKDSSITLNNVKLTADYQVWIYDTVYNCQLIEKISIEVSNDCVRPGDANNDGTVNHRDLLYIGIGNGEAEFTRTNATTDWIPQISRIWNKKTYGGILPSINYKHFDTDGNGTINEADTFAIFKNYGKGNAVNDELTGQLTTDAPVYFSFTKDTFYAGDKVIVYMHLGSENNLLPPLYGIAWRLRYKSDFAVPGSEKFELLCDDFCADDAPYISILKNYSGNTIDLAIVRTNHESLVTRKPVLKIEFMLKDSNYNYPPTGNNILLEHLDGLVLDKSGGVINYTALNGVALVLRKNPNDTNHIGIAPESILHNINIYPNPANTEVIISGYSETGIANVTLTNTLGQIILEQKLQPNQNLKLNVKHFPAGLYMVTVKNYEKQTVKKLMIGR